MKLYYSPTSPFVRKVNVFAAELGLDKEIEWVRTNPWQVEEKLTQVNPLSKVPALITDENEVIYDSRVICEYLDTLHNKEKLHPLEGEQRWTALRLQSLADGILEAGIARFLEKKRSVEQQSSDWDSLQKEAVERGLNELESSFHTWNVRLDIGVICIACVLGWLDFRFSKEDWRANRSNLEGWFKSFSNRDSMISTVPREPQ